MLFDSLYELTHKFMFESRLVAAGAAVVFSFIASMLLFPSYIKKLQKMQFISELTDSGTQRQPVMPAGILFLVIISISVMLFARMNSYMISALAIYVFFSLIGAVDDVAKVINKGRLARGQISKEEYMYKADGISGTLRLSLYLLISLAVAGAAYKFIPGINGHITIPFFSIEKYFPYMVAWIFIPFMALVIAVMANGVNFTDGFDTLAGVPLITCLLFVGLISYVSSHAGWSSYLRIPCLPGLLELLPLIGAAVGTLLAFLWFNSPPSSIIMGDSGSIGLGGLVGILFIFVKAEWYLPIIGFIFIIEFASSFLQIGWYKLTKKRLFRMAPIHHHFQIYMREAGYYGGEMNIKSKIAWRFHILSVILLVVGVILFLKVR